MVKELMQQFFYKQARPFVSTSGLFLPIDKYLPLMKG
jgi:hypothetical protein